MMGMLWNQTKWKSKQSGPKSEESDRVKIWAVWLSENHWPSKNLIIGQVKIRPVWPSEKKQIHRYRSKKPKASPHLTWQPAVLINLDCALDKMRLRTRTMTRARLMTMTRTRINGGGWLEGLFLEVWDRSRGSNLIEIWGRKIWEKAPDKTSTTSLHNSDQVGIILLWNKSKVGVWGRIYKSSFFRNQLTKI